MPRVYQVATLNMAFCLDCHRRAHDLPVERPAPSVADSLRGDAELARFLAHRPVDHAITPLTTCSACHR
jgi:cytochrome c553